MAEEPEGIVLHYLRSIDSKVDHLAMEVRDLRERVAAVETGLIAVKRDLVALAEADARLQTSFDRLGDRVERIARRLDLAEPA